MNPITGDSVMTGVGNVVMNNLNVNMFHADSQWAIDFGYKSGGTLRDGLMFIWSDWTGFDPAMDALIRDRNALSGNLRVDVPALTDLFFNPDSDDWRLKPSGLSLLQPGVFVDPASVAGLAAGVKGISGMNASRDAGFIDSLIDAGLIGRYFDKAGNERPAVPAPGAYEAYGSDGKIVPVVTALEDSRRIRTLVRLDGITAAASPNPAAGGVRIGYTLPEDLGHLEITLWNVQGRMVYNLFHGAHQKGSYARFWNGLNHENRPVPAGAYVIRLRSGIRHFETRVTLVR